MNFILLDKENREDFISVYPSVIPDDGERISIGAGSDGGEALGAVSVVYLNCQILIDWLYVDPLARNRGIGSALIAEIIEMITKTGERYPLVARFPVTEEEDSLHRFFLSLEEFEVSFSHDRYYVTAKDLREIKPFRKQMMEEEPPGHFFEEPVAWQKQILSQLESEQVYSVPDYGKWKEDCVPELCLSFVMDGELVGLIFVTKRGEDLELAWLYSVFPSVLYRLLKEALETADQLYPEADLTFEVMSEEAGKLAKKFFPDARREHIYEAEW